MTNKEKYMFQYALSDTIIEDTGLINLDEAEKLWDKYQLHIKENWNAIAKPQMCIWRQCEHETDYSMVLREIDWQDCERIDGEFYKITKEKI